MKPCNNNLKSDINVYYVYYRLYTYEWVYCIYNTHVWYSYILYILLVVLFLNYVSIWSFFILYMAMGTSKWKCFYLFFYIIHMDIWYFAKVYRCIRIYTIRVIKVNAILNRSAISLDLVFIYIFAMWNVIFPLTLALCWATTLTIMLMRPLSLLSAFMRNFFDMCRASFGLWCK